MKIPDLEKITNDIISGIQFSELYSNVNITYLNEIIIDGKNKECGKIIIGNISIVLNKKVHFWNRMIWFLCGFKYEKPNKLQIDSNSENHKEKSYNITNEPVYISNTTNKDLNYYNYTETNSNNNEFIFDEV